MYFPFRSHSLLDSLHARADHFGFSFVLFARAVSVREREDVLNLWKIFHFHYAMIREITQCFIQSNDIQTKMFHNSWQQIPNGEECKTLFRRTVKLCNQMFIIFNVSISSSEARASYVELQKHRIGIDKMMRSLNRTLSSSSLSSHKNHSRNGRNSKFSHSK